MVLQRFFLRYAALCLIVLAAGCASTGKPGSGSVPVEKEPEYTTVTPPATTPGPAEPAASEAYGPLLDKAEQATASGDYEQALALLERAQRIDPDSAEIYLNMARTHQARGDTDQARATAERGLLYCRGTHECDALRKYTR